MIFFAFVPVSINFVRISMYYLCTLLRIKVLLPCLEIRVQILFISPAVFSSLGSILCSIVGFRYDTKKNVVNLVLDILNLWQHLLIAQKKMVGIFWPLHDIHYRLQAISILAQTFRVRPTLKWPCVIFYSIREIVKYWIRM